MASAAIAAGTDWPVSGHDQGANRYSPLTQINKSNVTRLAQAWTYLESAYWMCLRAAWLYDNGRSCGAEANAAKFLAARACFDACTTAVLTHGGMGYAREYQVERLFRESILPRIAPVTEQLILSFIAERVLGLPKSY